MIAFEVRLLDTQLTLLRFSSVAAVCVRITATLLATRGAEAKVRWMTGTQFCLGLREPLAGSWVSP